MVKESPRGSETRVAKPPQERGRSSVALAAAGMGEFEWNRVTDRFIVSERMAAITGIPGGSTRALGGRAALDYIYPDDISVLETQIEPYLTEGDRCEFRFRVIRPEMGDLMWVSLSAVLIRDAQGAIEKVIGAVRDISGRKAEEQEHDALLIEIDHRVKNILDCVRSVATQSARRSGSVESFMRAFSDRLDAMAAAHTLLTAMRRRGADIDHIAAAELAGLAYGRAKWSGPAIILTLHATNTLTLALHELAANSVKYGALSVEAGQVDVVWRSTADGGFELTWIETRGPPVADPAHRGFGRELLEVVTSRELGGTATLEFKTEGLRAVITAGPETVSETAEESPAPIITAPADAALPRSPTKAGHDGASREGRNGGKANIARLRVLIVEDSALLSQELKKGLKALGAKVIGAAARVEDAERFLSFDFDVAVLDVDLNGQSGVPIGQALADRDIPFVLTIGGDEAALAPRGLNAPVVRKPYTLDQIAAAIWLSRNGEG